MSDSFVPAGKQVVLILVGLIGSGKSTFAQARFHAVRATIHTDFSHRLYRNTSLSFVGVIKTIWATDALTNFDASQRAHWIKIAREFPGTLVWVLVFDIPKDVCASRLRTRTQHPTIPNPEDALSILERFSSQYRAPSEDEGYDRILYLQPSEQEVVYIPTTLAAILQRVRDAPSVAPSALPEGLVLAAVVVITSITLAFVALAIRRRVA
ncbi:hypothetical protein MVEN_01020500 [Mycena venus]|uniref:P-loop containing nucleoside triphosphate hydrolase protein n=1 Tax=Mycena venus TaxID=2733690 RepID=A0A8H7D2Z4_9AGAR|nr:hypothetical protein MVEN_01020500 [Mycena venus]